VQHRRLPALHHKHPARRRRGHARRQRQRLRQVARCGNLSKRESRHRTRRRLVAALTLSLTTLSGTSAARAKELPPDLAVVTRTGDVLFLRGGVVMPAAHDGIVALDGRTFVSAEHRATFGERVGMECWWS
jgi:hypothetical protein